MTRHTLGDQGKDALISTMFQVGSHSNNDNIQVNLRKYLAMTSCSISAVIDLSLRFQPIKHVEQSSFIQIVDMNRFFTGNPVSVRLIDYRKKS